MDMNMFIFGAVNFFLHYDQWTWRSSFLICVNWTLKKFLLSVNLHDTVQDCIISESFLFLDKFGFLC